jgi:hypothetical protein
MPSRHCAICARHIRRAVLLLVAGCVVAAHAQEREDFDICGVLSDAEWGALVGNPYYGPKAQQYDAKPGAVNAQCTVNFTEIWIRRPSPVKDSLALEAALRDYLDELATVEKDAGIEWRIEVAPTETMQQPAVGARIIAESGDVAGTEVFYLITLVGDALIQVKSGNSPEEALAVAKAVAGKFRS